MPGYINQAGQNAQLDYIKTATTMVFVDTLSVPPAYGDIAGTNIKATKTTPVFSANSGADGSARLFTVSAITGMTIANTGNIRKWVLTDGTTTILAAGDVTGAPIAVVEAETWSTGSVTVTAPSAA